MHPNRFHLALICGTALSNASATGAFAQSASDAASPAATAPSAGTNGASTRGALASATSPENMGIEAIVVTARKRSELERDIPVSVQTVSGAQLSAAKITQIIDLSSRVPTLTISTGLTQPFVGIRGFGSGNSQSFDQAVGKFIDNVSYGRDQDARLPLFDLERVEVLKGPQVLLYGNSTTAGALNITTRKPGNQFEADGSVAYEFNNNEVVTQGGVTAPISQDVSLRVSGLYQNLARGPDFNVATGKHVATDKNFAGRGILKLTPTSKLEILLKAEYDHIRNKGAVGEPIAQPFDNPNEFTEVNLDGRINSPSNVAPLFQKDFISVDNETYQIDVNYEALGGTISSTTAYRRLEVGLSASGGTPTPVFNGFIGYTNKQFSQELRYAARFGPLEVTLGGFYQHEKRISITTADFLFPPGLFPVNGFAGDFVEPLKVRSASGFGDLTYHITDRLSLEAGGRYTDISQHASQSAEPGALVPDKRFGEGFGVIDPQPNDPIYSFLYGAFFGVPQHSFTGLEAHETHFQPQVIGQYKITDKDQIYAKYVKGDKAGGFDVAYQGAPPVGPTTQGVHFKPEKAESFEIGFKGLALDNKLDFALAAYRTTFTNLQTNAYVGQATVTVVANVGKARTQGFEAEFHYAPVRGIRIDASGAYTDAKYLSFPGGACTRDQQAAMPVGCVQDLSNTPTPFSSKWSGTFGVDYETPIGDYTLGAGALVVARSKYNPTTNREPLLEQNGYAQLDAHIDLKPTEGHWSLSMFGRDLTGKRVIEYGSVAPGTNGGLLAFRSRGRQLGIRLGANF